MKEMFCEFCITLFGAFGMVAFCGLVVALFVGMFSFAEFLGEVLK